MGEAYARKGAGGGGDGQGRAPAIRGPGGAPPAGDPGCPGGPLPYIQKPIDSENVSYAHRCQTGAGRDPEDRRPPSTDPR